MKRVFKAIRSESIEPNDYSCVSISSKKYSLEVSASGSEDSHNQSYLLLGSGKKNRSSFSKKRKALTVQAHFFLRFDYCSRTTEFDMRIFIRNGLKKLGLPHDIEVSASGSEDSHSQYNIRIFSDGAQFFLWFDYCSRTTEFDMRIFIRNRLKKLGLPHDNFVIVHYRSKRKIIDVPAFHHYRCSCISDVYLSPISFQYLTPLVQIFDIRSSVSIESVTDKSVTTWCPDYNCKDTYYQLISRETISIYFETKRKNFQTTAFTKDAKKETTSSYSNLQK